MLYANAKEGDITLGGVSYRFQQGQQSKPMQDLSHP